MSNMTPLSPSELRALIDSARSIPNKPELEKSIKFSSISEAMEYNVKHYPTSPFLISYTEHTDNGELQRREFTYSDFHQRVISTAKNLIQLGVSKGKRIAVASHNHHDIITVYFSAWIIGACVAPLNMTEDDNRLSYILSNAGITLTVAHNDYLTRVRGLSNETTPTFSLDSITANNNEVESFTEFGLWDDEALLVYTSGTTGNPKGVVLTQMNLLADAEDITSWHGINNSTKMMCVLPIHHVNGTIVTHVSPFYVGASVVLNRKFSASDFFGMIEREKVNVVSVVPTLLAFLLETYKESEYSRPTSLQAILCGAGPLTCELARQFTERFAIRITHGYGLSETTCYSCFIDNSLSDEEYANMMYSYGFPSIGAPLPHNEMQIHDENGSALGEMQRGEIVVRGWNVMREYDANPTANSDTFKYGWFRSGDEGFYVTSPNGKPYFFITGRIKELIIRGGVNIAPLEIDEVINQAPGVKAGISVGFENDFYGEEVGALVVARSNTDKDAILHYCNEKLPFSKVPKVVVFTDELPVTSTGKYQRNKVKHLFSEWKAVQFKKTSS
jgi:acyl-CoA synthetase (AMP-forming)/AMP-acid ligase II